MPPKKKKKKDEVEKVQEEIKQDASDELDETEESETVARKKVIYLEIDDEITDVYEKVKKVNGKHVYIVAPKRAVVFQSIVNLKILKRKAKEDKKTIYFITNDPNGTYLAQQIGITVYDKVNAGGRPSLFSTEINDEKLRITPLKATVNSIEEEAPTRLKERKISISEILRKNRGKKTFDVTKVDKPKVKKQKQTKRPKLILAGPSRHALLGLLGITVAIFLVVMYIALPGATIYLTPAASVLEKSVNINMMDATKNRAILQDEGPHMVASYPISITFDRSITHSATGKKFSERGAHATGKLTIINTNNTAWPLIANTRFQNDEGLIYRISDEVLVPAATASGFGTLEVFVQADPVDAFGGVIGERGNIGPSKFFLPGLREDSQAKLYAESYEQMTGGITDFITFVTEEDIVAAEARINEELAKKADEELQLAVDEKGVELGIEGDFVLLEGEGAVRLGEAKVSVPNNIVGQEIGEFIASGSMEVSGVYYDKLDMLDILKEELSLKKSPQKELVKINEDSTNYRIFEWNQDAGQIKLTANIKGIEQYEIDPQKDNGAKLLGKIRDHIKGMDVDEAKQFIQNLPEVNKVEIESWPFWAPAIPNLADNIKFDVREAAAN